MFLKKEIFSEIIIKNIFKWTFVLVFIHLKRSEAWFEQCDHTIQINNSMYIRSPYYPNRYPSGSSCRYSIIAPLDHEINIECDIEIDKLSSDCTSEFMYVAIDGDHELRGSEYFCGTGYIQRKSSFNKLVIAYTSSSNRYAGKFSCFISINPQPCDCGWSNRMKMRIVSGTQTQINEYPFMVGLLHNPTNKLYCGASIISHRFVLTAAHCIYAHPNSYELSVVVGEHDLKTASETPYTKIHRVSYYKVHENYAPNDSDRNDIAIIATATIIEWSPGVGPVCLPFLYSFANFNNVNAEVLGWGTVSFGGPSSSVLLKATVQIISNPACNQFYQTIYDSQMCTYSPPRDSCQFDSGGPLVGRFTRLFLLGIISYGKACGTDYPSVNTRVTSYLNWIQTNTGESFCRKG